MVILIIYAYICHVLDAEIIFLLTEEIRFLVTEIGPWGHFSLEARPPDSLVTLRAPEILKSLQINKLKLIKLHQKRSRKVAVCTLAKGFLRNSIFSKEMDQFLKKNSLARKSGLFKVSFPFEQILRDSAQIEKSNQTFCDSPSFCVELSRQNVSVDIHIPQAGSMAWHSLLKRHFWYSLKREAVKLYAFTRSYVLTKHKYAKVGWVKVLELERKLNWKRN